MTKRIAAIATVLLLTAASIAHTEEVKDLWKLGGNLGLNFSNVSLSNWNGGGKNTVSITGSLGAFGNYSGKSSEWSNMLDVGYGVTKLGDLEFRKSDDKLIFISKYGYKATESLSYSSLLDFRTQFNYGYNFDKRNPLDSTLYLKISAPMAPAYLNVGIGMNYKPADYLQIMLSPVANRLIIVLDEELSNKGAFGVDKGKKIKSELGSSFNAIFKKEIFQNVVLQSRLNLFSSFSHFDKVVVNSESVINMKINSFLSATISADIIYDHNVKVVRDDGTTGPAMQFRNVLGIGFSYMIK